MSTITHSEKLYIKRHTCLYVGDLRQNSPCVNLKNSLWNLVKLHKPLWKIKTGVCADHRAEQLDSSNLSSCLSSGMLCKRRSNTTKTRKSLYPDISVYWLVDHLYVPACWEGWGDLDCKTCKWKPGSQNWGANLILFNITHCVCMEV